INGGEMEVTHSVPAVGRYQSGGIMSRGVLDVRAGSFSQTAEGFRLFVGEEGSGVLNVRGTGLAQVTGGMFVGGGTAPTPGDPGAEPPVEPTPGTAGRGVVNLIAGGTLATAEIGQLNAAHAFGTLNFHGGLLRALRPNEVFINSLDQAFVYAG